MGDDENITTRIGDHTIGTFRIGDDIGGRGIYETAEETWHGAAGVEITYKMYDETED